MDNKDRYLIVETWTEDNLLDLPSEETDYYEYKSSQMSLDKLKDEIQIAASAFWNSGGGVFIAGVDDDGKVDGGVPEKKGKQKLGDWVDQILAAVEPMGLYTKNLISRERADSLIEPGHVVLVISFRESFAVPHMAPDKKYYARVGAHSGPAGHFLVEAIRARRGLHKPLLRGLLRKHDQKPRAVELIVLALNEAAALDVKLWFEPFPIVFQRIEDTFPLHIPIINQRNPFSMEVSTTTAGHEKRWGTQPVYLELEYEDIAGTKFREHQLLDQRRSLGPVEFKTEESDDVKKTLQKIAQEFRTLNQTLENDQESSSISHSLLGREVTMSREVIATPNAPAAIGPYSQGIKANGLVFVSGQGGLVPETKQFAGSTVAAQTAQTLKNISAILAAAGTNMAHVVKINVLLLDIGTFAEMNTVYQTFFPSEPPSRMTYAVKDLPLGALVEIDAIAVMPD